MNMSAIAMILRGLLLISAPFLAIVASEKLMLVAAPAFVLLGVLARFREPVGESATISWWDTLRPRGRRVTPAVTPAGLASPDDDEERNCGEP